MRLDKYLQLAVAGSIALLTGTAIAATNLTLTGPITGNAVGPQSASAPCIIAGTNCSQPAGFGFNNFTPNSLTSADRYSNNVLPGADPGPSTPGTPYTVSQLTGLFGVNGSFDVAIDVNTTVANGETLNLFQVIINGIVQYVYDPGIVGDFTDGTQIAPVNNNGNGYADWLLQTISLAGLNPNDTVLFRAIWSGASDGAESFFLVASGSSPPTGLPEPATLGLVGLALLGVGASRRGRKA